MKFFKRNSHPKTREFDPDLDARDWTIYHLSNEETGSEGLIRIRTTRPPHVDTSDFSTAISIKWKYQDSTLPDSELNETMYAFERSIDELTTANGFSELVQVSTGFGEREWLFYSSNRAQFMARLNELLARHAPYPLEISFYRDPKWKVWRDMLDPLLARTSDA